MRTYRDFTSTADLPPTVPQYVHAETGAVVVDGQRWHFRDELRGVLCWMAMQLACPRKKVLK